MDDLNLSDFLSDAGSAYSTYTTATNSSAQTNAQIAAANAAAATANATTASSAATKTWLLIGGAVVLVGIIVIALFKRR